MSLKQEIETWVDALRHYDAQEYEEALKIFETNADTSKIYFNIGMIYATLGEHEKAVEAYQQATRLDQFLAVSYFQQGVSNFLLMDFNEALANFNEALLYLRGNTLIDYEQLGLKFRLYSCEILFNRGLCYIYDDKVEEGMKDLEFAAKEKQIEDHNVIDEAISEKAEGYTVFSIPVGIVYRPNESKVRNVKAKDYLGKARLVAASDRANAFTGFTGTEVKKMQSGDDGVKDDRPLEGISFAATNLVVPNLKSSRGDTKRQEPSGSFPPTPPPEKDVAGLKRSNTTGTARGLSVRRPPELRERRNREAESDAREEERSEEPFSRRGSTRELPRRAASSASRSNPPSRSRATSRRRYQDRIDEFTEGDEDQYNEDLYDLYNESRRSGGSIPKRGLSRRGTTRNRYMDDDEYASDAYEGSSLDEDEFEMLDPRSNRSRRVPDIRKIKVKCHDGDDTRVIMVNTDVEFTEFVSRLKDKFGYQKKVRCKVKDEDGDGFVNISDQEDLDMVISASKKIAKRERLETGKMEIWVTEE